jgi:hypothetical protein
VYLPARGRHSSQTVTVRQRRTAQYPPICVASDLLEIRQPMAAYRVVRCGYVSSAQAIGSAHMQAVCARPSFW